MKHYAGGVNSEFSNFGLSQTQMGILVNKLVNWVLLDPCKSPDWFHLLRKSVLPGDTNKAIESRIDAAGTGGYRRREFVIQYNPAAAIYKQLHLIQP